MSHSLNPKPVAAQLAAGLAALSLLAVPAVATASVAHGAGAPASHGHHRHHRRPHAVSQAIQAHMLTKTKTVTKTIPSKTVTKTIPGKTVTRTVAAKTVTKAVPGKNKTVTVTVPAKTVTVTVPAKTVTVTVPAKTVTVTVPAKTVTVPVTTPAPATPPLPTPPVQPTTPLVPTPAPANSQFFSANSIWNQQVPAGAALDPNSSAVVNDLIQQETNSSVGVQTTQYGVPIYTVAADQPTVPVTIASNVTLNAAMSAVPLPANAVPAAGTDGNLAVWQPSTNTMWEFWRITDSPNGWVAEWGGVMSNVSSDPGYYQNIEGPTGGVFQRNNWGAPATSFPLVAGVMTIAELQSGQINHALSLALPQTKAGEWVSPAQRSDGNSLASDAIPEGAHFRLNPDLNLASLNLPPFVYEMAVAAQKYGIIINNTSAGVAFRAEDPTQFIAQHGYNPYMGPANQPGTAGALFNQWPSQMLRLFPWSQLQLLPMSVQTQVSTTWITQ